MAGDGVLISLIGVSVTAPARPRRVAAGILIQALQSGMDTLPRIVRQAEAELGHIVADEIGSLIQEFGLTPDGDDRAMPEARASL